MFPPCWEIDVAQLETLQSGQSRNDHPPRDAFCDAIKARNRLSVNSCPYRNDQSAYFWMNTDSPCRSWRCLKISTGELQLCWRFRTVGMEVRSSDWRIIQSESNCYLGKQSIFDTRLVLDFFSMFVTYKKTSNLSINNNVLSIPGSGWNPYLFNRMSQNNRIQTWPFQSFDYEKI